ncbi:hypothetical protein GCM10011351_07210 [Paraliobacillus quinghaiensis]|uniref:FAD/FMN-containing dehydrogenase n=1 Tax=Paraliobacillus quinghaiensis TaxID=470815 RepID=A0A917WS51_9BACI|nr:hypothetical protein [Paraliobacillus quinghaiensis]GGM23998.1 hypothetical protein GCM10011351_07210 [Paraliobacillus quinghaiensis]
MKKKIVAGILGIVILLGGAGSYVYANTANPSNWWSFEEMQPYMEEMHPGFSTEQQQEMFNDCHGENGYYSDRNRSRGMMNNYNFD